RVVPLAACSMLRAISRVAAPCSSTAAAMVEAISEVWAMVPPISLMAATESWVAVCMPAIWLPISSVALAVWAASALTSWATTAKPLPASPARAASMVALGRRDRELGADTEVEEIEAGHRDEPHSIARNRRHGQAPNAYRW